MNDRRRSSSIELENTSRWAGRVNKVKRSQRRLDNPEPVANATPERISLRKIPSHWNVVASERAFHLANSRRSGVPRRKLRVELRELPDTE